MNPFWGFIFLYFLLSFNVECNNEENLHARNNKPESNIVNQYTKMNLTETQAALYKRIKATKLLINPYVNLFLNQSEFLLFILTSRPI